MKINSQIKTKSVTQYEIVRQFLSQLEIGKLDV